MKSPRHLFTGLLMLLVVGVTAVSLASDIPVAVHNYSDSWAGNDLLRSGLSPEGEPPLFDGAGRWPIFQTSTAGGTVPFFPEVVPSGGVDTRVNAIDNPQYDTVQSETSIALNRNTGTICIAYNDIYHYYQGYGICGFSRSTDEGATWQDGGPIPLGPGSNSCRGDPSVTWRAADGYFYFAALDNGGPSNPNGISIWRSTDDCASFQWLATATRSGYDDKELLTVDNHPTSPYYGHFYIAWLRLDNNLHYSTYSSDGLTWSSPLNIGDPTERPAGDFPIVAPNGDLYIGWAGWDSFPFGNVDQDMIRSTDGGTSFSWITPPAENILPPRDPTAEDYCNFIAIRGFMRYLPSLQIAITPGATADDYCMHVVYPRDPDGYAVGDAANVYYRRSCDNGATWSLETKLNDDGGLTDQFYPSLAANDNGVVIATWYDRRNDPDFNYYFERWGTVSYDNGTTWESNRQISDVASSVNIGPLSFCNHGDYDLMAADADYAYVVWADDRVYFNGHYDQDIWFDKLPLWPDFDLQADETAFAVCRPGTATTTLDIGSIAFYNQPIQLSDNGVPTDINTSFSVNPVTPEGTSKYTIEVTADATDDTYAWDVQGTSPTTTHGVSVTLSVNSTIPSPPSLISPPDEARKIPLGHILFQWGELASVGGYHLQVDDNPDFSSPEADVSEIESNSYDLPGQLLPSTTYYWHIAATNACGESAFTAYNSFSTAAPCLLLVDDDNNDPDMAPYFQDALNRLGYSYDIFDVGGGTGDGPTFDLMKEYSMIIWFSGDKVGGGAGPNATDETNLTSYLNSGGRLFLSSQDYLHDRGLNNFGQAYLGVASFTDDGSDPRVMVGQAGDPIGAGTTYLPAYPPDFMERGDVVNPTGGTMVAFKSRTGNNLALDRDGGVWRTVFFANDWVPLHFLQADQDAAVLGRIVEWLGGCPNLEPAIVVDPPTLEATLETGDVLTQTMWVSNVGDSDLDWAMSELSSTLMLFDIPWLSETPLSGTVLPGGSTPVTVTFDATGLSSGVYLGQLDVQSNDPIYPHVYTPLSLTVTYCEPVTNTVFIWQPLNPFVDEVITITASAEGTEPITFTWDLGDGTSASGSSITHTYTLAGPYTVTLTATNCLSATETVQNVLQVSSQPVEYFYVYLPLMLRER